MQTSVPELVDVSNESQATLDLYGPDVKKPGSFAYNCLLARRMAERPRQPADRAETGDRQVVDANEAGPVAADDDKTVDLRCQRRDDMIDQRPAVEQGGRLVRTETRRLPARQNCPQQLHAVSSNSSRPMR